MVLPLDTLGRKQPVPKVVFVGSDGQERPVEAQVGESVMSAAVRVGIPGIVGECNGNTSCATCHVWVREEFVPLVGVPEPGGMEDDLLDLGVGERRATSRLSCNIKMSTDLDGLVVEVPASQF